MANPFPPAHLRVFLEETAAVARDRQTWPEGTIHYEVCRFCGGLSWRQTSLNAPTEVLFSPSGPCAECQRFHQRFPDVAAWVAKVMGFHQFLEHWEAP